MNEKIQGVISYAGMDVQTLLAGARLMFAGDGSGEESRLTSVMPLFPAELILSMPFVGVAQPGMNVAPGGFSIDPAEYHCRLQARMPRLYAGDNLLRNTDGEGQFHGRGVVTVDEVWTTCFPQYQPYAGERLAIYPLGGGAQCAAVPESLYPRAAGFLRQAETALGVTGRCHDYAHYVYARIRSGQSFDADLFETEYLADRELAPVTITQRDLGRLMQDLSMLRSVREGSEGGGLYTENAKRSEHIRQYVPGLYACDVFEETPQSRYTAKLVQPLWEDGFVSDWWMPWQDAQAYLNREKGALDMSALCDGYQIAPVYDPATRGGRYPTRLRMVSVRDKELKLRMGDTLNNPAYGSGMSPAGSINKLVYLPDSRELLRQGRLEAEEAVIFCEKTTVPPEAYREMTALASLQEGKGRLVDALYRRESVLSEVRELSPDYAPLRQTMNEPVERLESAMARREKAGLSGYDADLDYLRRMGMEREWKPMPNKQKTFRFAPDALRQASIESGFAMRTACLRCDWDDLQLAEDEAGVVDAGAVAGAAADAAGMAADVYGAAGELFAEPEDLFLSGMEWEEEAALWENAADPWYLTTEAGGLYPTDEAVAAGAPLPVPGQKPAAAEPAKNEEKPAKAKKGGKGRKKTAAQAAARPSKPGNDRKFTEEELVERQTHMTLPQEEADDPAAGGDMGERADGVAGEAAGGKAAESAVETIGGKSAESAAETISGKSAESAAETIGGKSAELAVETIGGKSAESAAETISGKSAESAVETIGGKSAESAAETTGGQSAESAAETTGGKSAELAVETISGKSAESAVETIGGQSAESAAETIGGKSAELAAETIGGKSAESAAESVVETIGGQPAESAAETTGGQPAESATETTGGKSAELAAETISGKSAELAAETIGGKPAESAAESVVETIGGQPAESAAETTGGKTAESAAETISGKSAESAAETISGKSAESAAETTGGQPAESAAETIGGQPAESAAETTGGQSAESPAGSTAAHQPAGKPGKGKKGKKGKKKQPAMPEGQLSFLTDELF